MAEVVVIGGGFSGCAAAISASKTGAKVTLLERTDMLTGLALVAGVMGMNGGITLAEEVKAMGGSDMFDACDSVTKHRIEQIADRRNLSIYNVFKIEGAVEKALQKAGVHIMMQSRGRDVDMTENAISAIILNDNSKIKGDAFVEATGTAGTMEECKKYGHGCCMCILRCPTFGSRVSIAGKAEVKEKMGQRYDGTLGAMSAAFTLAKESIEVKIVKEMEKNGFVKVPIPKELIRYEKFKNITATINVIKEFTENLFLFDIGYAKVMVQSYMPLQDLKRIPGFEYARMVDPYSGGIGNSIRYLHLAPRDNRLKVEGVKNLFCAGEKANFHGLADVIVSGVLAGYNAARYAQGKSLLELPRTIATGDLIAYTKERMEGEEYLKERYASGAGHYFERMKELGLYTTDKTEIRKRIEREGLTEIFSKV